MNRAFEDVRQNEKVVNTYISLYKCTDFPKTELTSQFFFLSRLFV